MLYISVLNFLTVSLIGTGILFKLGTDRKKQVKINELRTGFRHIGRVSYSLLS